MRVGNRVFLASLGKRARRRPLGPRALQEALAARMHNYRGKVRGRASRALQRLLPLGRGRRGSLEKGLGPAFAATHPQSENPPCSAAELGGVEMAILRWRRTHHA